MLQWRCSYYAGAMMYSLACLALELRSLCFGRRILLPTAGISGISKSSSSMLHYIPCLDCDELL